MPQEHEQFARIVALRCAKYTVSVSVLQWQAETLNPDLAKQQPPNNKPNVPRHHRCTTDDINQTQIRHQSDDC